MVLKPAHGIVVTSATLTGGGQWDVAEARTGAVHLDTAVQRFAVESPFDYASQAEVLIVTDIKPIAGRRLCAADRGGGRRRAGAVHRDPAAEGGPRPHRRSPRP